MAEDRRETVLVSRSHPEPTQTFHRRTAAALSALGEPVVRVALRRAKGAPAVGDGTVVLAEAGSSAARAFFRRPLRATGLLAALVARARGGDKEGGRLGAAAAWLDGLRLCDWARRRGGVGRFHAQFASWEASAAWTAARCLPAAFSFEAHNPYTLVRGRGALAAKTRAADVVAAISDDAKARLVALEPTAAGKTSVVRCGVDPAALARAAASAAGGAPAFDVVAVGSLVERKGHDVLVAAAARLKSTHPAARVAIVGEGPDRARLTEAVCASGAPVELLGARGEDETLAIVSAAKVAVLACRVAADGDEDGVPVALLEAMALSVPVVSTPVGGIADLLEEGRAGLLVPENDAAALAGSIARLLSDEGLRATLAERGRARVALRHDLAACAAALAGAWRAADRRRIEAS